VSRRIKSYRFPYVFIGLALAVVVFYRSPQGRGVSTITSAAPDDRRQSISPAMLVSHSSVEMTPPMISAPSGAPRADLTKVSLPAVRKAVPESVTLASASKAPDVPSPVKERIYLPDSYNHALPATPVNPEEMHQGRGRAISHGNETLNQIALTFDDGPNNKHTPQILDILRKYNVKGTFFVLGIQVRDHPAILRRIVEEGHEIGNHTYGHPQLKRLTEERVRQELVSTQEEIQKAVGLTPKFLRPPYGAFKNESIPLFDELGFRLILWSVDTKDWKKKSGEAIIQTVSRDTKNGSIILFHDSKAETVRVLPQIIEDILARGFQPVTISQMTGLPAYDNGDVAAGAPAAQSGSLIQ
jgi:peptidoglycan-N-acetylglucosamine deacetylase